MPVYDLSGIRINYVVSKQNYHKTIGSVCLDNATAELSLYVYNTSIAMSANTFPLRENIYVTKELIEKDVKSIYMKNINNETIVFLLNLMKSVVFKQYQRFQGSNDLNHFKLGAADIWFDSKVLDFN